MHQKSLPEDAVFQASLIVGRSGTLSCPLYGASVVPASRAAAVIKPRARLGTSG